MNRQQVVALIALAVICIAILAGIAFYISLERQTANYSDAIANTIEALDITTQQTIEAIQRRDKP